MTRRPEHPGASSPAKSNASGAETGSNSVKMVTTATLRYRVAELAGRRSTAFLLEPDTASRTALARELGLSSLPRLRFEGKLEPKGRRDWELTARLGASVVQPCVVTLEPVKTRIDEKVERLFSADFIEPEGDEVEMPEDDRLEPLPDTIDIGEIMTEALSLALPLYPRSESAAPVEAVAVTPPGAEPIKDEDVKPFAGLKSLREQLFGAQEGEGDSPETKKDGKLH